MAKSIFIRRTPSGGWCGTVHPMPKMPAKENVHEWKDFESMVLALRALHLKVVVSSEELIWQLARHGISASKIL